MLFKPPPRKKELPKKVIKVDMEKIQQRKIQKEKTIEEILQEKVITQTEQKALDRVFKIFTQNKPYFTVHDVSRVLKNLEFNDLGKVKQFEEVDNNLDNQVDKNEFEFMYKRNIYDKNGQEPKSLFHVVQFLMYCKDNQFKITVEDTLEYNHINLLFDQLKDFFLQDWEEDNLIKKQERFLGKVIQFSEEEKNENGQEKQISFTEYLEKICKRDAEQRKERQKEIQLLSKLPLKKNDKQKDIF